MGGWVGRGQREESETCGHALGRGGARQTHKPVELFDIPHALLLLALEHAEEERALALAVYKAARNADPKHDSAFDAPVHLECALGTSCRAAIVSPTAPRTSGHDG